MSDDIQLNDMCVTPDGPCETDDGPPEADSSTARDTQGETLSGGSQHAANADAQWLAITSAPDFCRVGNSVVGFDSTATLDSPVRYSPDVIAAGRELYRVGDLICGVQGDAGSGIVSGTSLGSGHVLITDGQDNVKVNGLPMARHDSACLINCNASGVGGAPGYLTTLRQTVQSAPGQAGAASDSEPSWNAGQEAGRVLNDKWEDAKSAARTAWEALPFTGDAATTAAARERVVQGAVDTYRGLDTLTGPSPLDLLDSGIGLATGDAERAARYGEEWQRTADAYGGIKDAVVDAWQEARERNGTLGAIEMSATVFAFELVGPKGSGAAKSAADLAEAAGDVSRRTPDTPSRAPEGDGVHISRNATNHQKGAFGEARAHEVMTRNGMEPIGRTDGVYQPGQTGIDGLYRNPPHRRPPDFVVTEAKFGRARLGKLADGTKQMSDDWVERNIEKAVDRRANPALYDELMESWETGRVDKYLVRVKHNGSTRVRQLDERARVIGTPEGF